MRARKTGRVRRDGPPIFLNISNHPLSDWPPEQVRAALRLAPGARLVDLPFPQVPPEAGKADVAALMEAVLRRVPAGTTHAMVMGEFALAFALVARLERFGVECFASTTTRRPMKEAFRFGRFRRYSPLTAGKREVRGDK